MSITDGVARTAPQGTTEPKGGRRSVAPAEGRNLLLFRGSLFCDRRSFAPQRAGVMHSAEVNAAHEHDEALEHDPYEAENANELGAANAPMLESVAAESHPEEVSNAFQSLKATKMRTGALATRADLHRVVKKLSLTPLDAVELETRAEEAGILEPLSIEEIEEASGFEADIVRMFIDDAKRYPLLHSGDHARLARAIEIGKEAAAALSCGPMEAAAKERLENLVREGQRAFSQFVASNVRLVLKWAANYMHQGLDYADLIQEGCVGLMRAAELYSVKEGTQFSTYAYWWIKQSITRGIADKSRLVRIPVHAHDELNRIRRAARDLSVRFGRDPSYSEIAEHLGLGVDKVAVLAQWSQQLVSLEAPMSEAGDLHLRDLLPCAEPTVEEDVEQRERDAAIMHLLSSCLTERQAAIIKMRFGLGGTRPMTLEEIGQKYGVTRERIRQIEAKALKILKKRAADDKVLRSWA